MVARVRFLQFCVRVLLPRVSDFRWLWSWMLVAGGWVVSGWAVSGWVVSGWVVGLWVAVTPLLVTLVGPRVWGCSHWYEIGSELGFYRNKTLTKTLIHNLLHILWKPACIMKRNQT